MQTLKRRAVFGPAPPPDEARDAASCAFVTRTRSSRRASTWDATWSSSGDMSVSTDASVFGGEGRGASLAPLARAGRRANRSPRCRTAPSRSPARRRSAPAGSAATCRRSSPPLARRGQTSHLISGADRGAPAQSIAGQLAEALAARLLKLPLPLTPGVRAQASAAEFDAFAARRLPPAEQLIAFNGQALRQFEAARRAGYRSTALVSANSHMRRVIRQHELAHSPVSAGRIVGQSHAGAQPARVRAGRARLRRLALQPRVVSGGGVSRGSPGVVSAVAAPALRSSERAPSRPTASRSSTPAASPCTRACRC